MIDQFRFVKRLSVTVGSNLDLVVNAPSGYYESGYMPFVWDANSDPISADFTSGRTFIYSTTGVLVAGLKYNGFVASKYTFETGIGLNTEINFL